MKPTEQTSEIDTEEPSNPGTGQELSPELQKLRELLQGDMEKMLIKPLEKRIIKLEKSHRQLESTLEKH